MKQAEGVSDNIDSSIRTTKGLDDTNPSSKNARQATSAIKISDPTSMNN